MPAKRIKRQVWRFRPNLLSRPPTPDADVVACEPSAPLAKDADVVACEELIWAENAGALRTRPLVDPTSWAGAFQRDLVHFGASRELRTPVESASAYIFAAVVMMVKDEADIIGENLVWLYRTGLRRFVILDNGSTDGTADIISHFCKIYPELELITVNDPLLRYMQSEKTTGLYRLAFSIWPDLRWVLPVDADEFLIAERGLSALDEVGSDVDAVTIPKVIHFRRKGSAPDGNIMEQLDYCSPMFFAPPKIIARPNPLATITQGNHQVRFPDERAAVYAGGLGHGLYYREFPNRSFEHFLRKVRNGGSAIKAAEVFLGHKVGGWHWVEYYETLIRDGEEHLREIYNEQYLKGQSEGFVQQPFSVDASGLRF